MENSIEKDEEILNNIKTYMQENIDKGWHKFVYNDLGYDEKCVDVINAIEHILSEYKKVLKENGELRERIKQLEDTNKKLYEIGKEIGKQHKYTSENYIPKSKVKEKIEEYEEKAKRIAGTYQYADSGDDLENKKKQVIELRTKAEGLQDFLEGK